MDISFYKYLHRINIHRYLIAIVSKSLPPIRFNLIYNRDLKNLFPHTITMSYDPERNQTITMATPRFHHVTTEHERSPLAITM